MAGGGARSMKMAHRDVFKRGIRSLVGQKSQGRMVENPRLMQLEHTVCAAMEDLVSRWPGPGVIKPTSKYGREASSVGQGCVDHNETGFCLHPKTLNFVSESSIGK